METKKNERWLFLFAHTDDDTLINGSMKKILFNGGQVFPVWILSGFSPKGIEIREAEANKAMDLLGVPKENRFFLGGPAFFILHLKYTFEKLRDIVDHIKPDKIMTPAFEGGHVDHDTTNFLAMKIAHDVKQKNPAVLLYEYPLYNGAGPAWRWWWNINVFPNESHSKDILYNKLSNEDVDLKYKIMKIYKSQWMYMIPARLASSRKRLTHVGEPYRIAPLDRDYSKRPHRGKLNSERWFNFWMGTSFEDFTKIISSSF